MTKAMLIEGIGYLGSILVVVSMLMTSVKKLRVVNTIGSVIFAIYALIIQSYPTAFMNFALVTINVINIVKLKKAELDYRVIECWKMEAVVQDFLLTYKADINKYFPSFLAKNSEQALTEAGLKIRDEGKQAFMICSDSRPVGLMIGNYYNDDTFDIELDYSIPRYRDCSVGDFIYRFLKEKSQIKRLRIFNPSSGHEPYLIKMGFVKEGAAKEGAAGNGTAKEDIVYIKQTDNIAGLKNN